MVREFEERVRVRISQLYTKSSTVMVIPDMIMPDMSGGETYDKLMEVNPDIKVLLASGYSLDRPATKILDRGCNGLIQKPDKTMELSQN